MNGDIRAIQASITNRLDAAVADHRRLAGVIGDTPSQYSKSPALWNAAFGLLGMNAIYLPFDVAESRLKDLTSALRDCQRVLGANVTVPHKRRIMEYLDELDAGAARIQAVNTVMRMNDGRLIGYNTDGQGFIESLRASWPGQARSFVESFHNLRALILGAGGSARAVAFALADVIENGAIILCNRTPQAAPSLAKEIRALGTSARAGGEEDVSSYASEADLIINCTVKGQGGVRTAPDGSVTMLAPYSALATAHPQSFSEARSNESDFQRVFMDACRSDIDANNQASWQIANKIPKGVGFYDLVYHPEETVFLRHGRLTGHRTMNGKAMIVCQAALAFCRHICKAELQARKLDKPETFKLISDTMYQAW